MIVLRRIDAVMSDNHSLTWRSLLIALAMCVMLFGSRCEATSVSTCGPYTIVAGVPEQDMKTVHAVMDGFGGLSIVFIDGFCGDGETAYYNAIYHPKDGVARELVLDWTVDQVRDRMKSNHDNNQLLHIDAYTKITGFIHYGEDYYMETEFDTFCCAIFCDEKLSERQLVYAPVKKNDHDLYWDDNAATIFEFDDYYKSYGYELTSACVVRPSRPVKCQKMDSLWDELFGDFCQAIGYSYYNSSIVALYARDVQPTGGLFEMSLPDAQDFADDEAADGYEVIQVEPYTGHPMAAMWSFQESAYEVKFGVLTQKDDLDHQVVWGIGEADVHMTHNMMHAAGYSPIAVTTSRWPGQISTKHKITMIFREIGVNENLDPQGGVADPPGHNDGSTRD